MVGVAPLYYRYPCSSVNVLAQAMGAFIQVHKEQVAITHALLDYYFFFGPSPVAFRRVYGT